MKNEEWMDKCLPRIILRPWFESDADALFALAGDPIIGESAGFPPHRDVDDSRRVIREILAKPGTFAVVSVDEDAVVGCVSALPSRVAVTAAGVGAKEIGYWIGRKYWGRGFATAAVTALSSLCATDDALRCPCLIGCVRAPNVGSRRVLEKCGFVLVEISNGFYRYEFR